MKAVVLLSGGLDSATTLAIAIREHQVQPSDVLCLSLYYGQKHSNELASAQKVAESFGSGWMQKQLPDIFEGYGSAIIGSGEVEMPHETYKEIAEGQGVSPTYVPFRNGNLLSAATAVALNRQAEAVYFGAHAEDARGWAYPDCTPEFIGAMANAIYVGTYGQVRLVTPLEWMMKSDIVERGTLLDVPFELTMSCYEGRSPACGRCPTCVERLQAFDANNLEDPIQYEDRSFWKSKTHV